MIIQITKAELRNLFYSPVAWFLILAFLVQCAYFFTSGLVTYAELQDMAIKNIPNYKATAKASYTRMLFLDGTFGNILHNLYLFIPLLTMGLIGKEVQQGTFRLLYSSPVKLRQIVIGKYLAIMLYNLLLVSVVGIFMVTACLSMIEVDYGMLLSAALGFYLLTCAYTAIGMFMSSITTHQIIAAVSTFLIIFCLSFIGAVWQKYDFVRDLTYFLHLPGRTDQMLVGLITTKDLIYFIVIVLMFVSFTMLRLRAAREAKPWYVSVTRYTVVVVAGLLIGYISSRPMLTGYWDTTAQDVNTIHEKTQELIKKMGDEPLEVTLYTNLLGPARGAGVPEARNTYLSLVWEKYLRFKPDIKFNYVYYYDHDSTIMGNQLYRPFPGKSLEYIANKSATIMGLDTADFLKPAEIRQMIDLRPENLRLVMKLKYKGRTEYLRTYDDSDLWPYENQFAITFDRLIKGVAPKLAFVTGHYERNILKTGEREYALHSANKEFRGALVNNGFDVDTISLDTQDIPTGLTALILADPKSELSPVCQEKIRQYISQGGSMFIMGEPGKQQMLNPLLKQVGVQLMDGQLVTPFKGEMPHMQNPPFTSAFKTLTGDSSISGHILMPGVAAIDYTDTAGFKPIPLLTTTAGGSWLTKGKVVVDSAMVQFNQQGGDQRSYFPTLGKQVKEDSLHTIQDHLQADTGADHSHDQRGGFVTLMALNRTVNGKDQRMLIAGDADFLSNYRTNQLRDLILLYKWMTNVGYPIDLPRPRTPDRLLTITGKRAEQLKIFYVWILPGLVFLAAAILLIRRKRK